MCAKLLPRDHFSRMCHQHSQYGKRLARQFQADSVTAEFSCSQIKGEVCEAEHAALGADGHENPEGRSKFTIVGPRAKLRYLFAAPRKFCHPSGLAVDFEIDFELTPCALWPRRQTPTFHPQRLSDPTGEPP